MAERPITEVFGLICDLATANGASNIKDLPGCWTYRSGIDFIAVNGHPAVTEAQVPDGGTVKVPPYGAVIFSNGWPVFMGNPFGGSVVMITEGQLLQRLHNLINQKAVQE